MSEEAFSTGYSRVVVVADSSNIEKMAYDVNTLKLRVWFRNGSVYDYADVEQKVFGTLCATTSVGKAFTSFGLHKKGQLAP